MAEPSDPRASTPVEVRYVPQAGNRALPVEVVDRASVLERRARSTEHRQRVGFNILMVCTAGEGSHVVDFEPVAMAPGTCLRVHPGQVQRFVPTPSFDAHLVIWPAGTVEVDPTAPAWYPGCGATTTWVLGTRLLDDVLRAVDDLRSEQRRFDGSPLHGALLQSMLRTLLLRLATAVPDSLPDPSTRSDAYVQFRRRIEERIHDRPRLADLAGELGYSTRTLDRAAQRATGRTARQVLDERTALEARRRLLHTDRSIAQVARDLGFTDTSNFSRFVRRQFGVAPTQLRARED